MLTASLISPVRLGIEDNPKCDRTVALYGYLRGTNFPAEGGRVHIPGVGDLSVAEVEALQDPCPTPFMDQAIAKASGKTLRRRLGEKQKVLFAPMSDVGGVLVDKDAVYIDIKTSTFDKDAANGEERGLGEQMVIGLQNERRVLGVSENGVKLFSNGTALEDDHENDMGRKSKRRARIAEREDENDEKDIIPDDEAYESGEDDENDTEHLDIGDVGREKLGSAFRGSIDTQRKGDGDGSFC